MDPSELNPGFKESVLMEDIETGETIEVSRKFIKNRYPEKIQQHINSINEAANGIGADHVLVNTSEPLDRALRSYLMFRQRRR
jgi:hypothetical protein